RNFPKARVYGGPVELLLPSAVGSRLSPSEQRFKRELGRVDVLVAGPPCQGHSDLNNHTRRSDPKNALFLKIARFAEVAEPTHLIVENVPGIKHDRGGVLEKTVLRLRKLGYEV